MVLRQGATGRWLSFSDPCRVLVARRTEEVQPLMREVEAAVGREGCAAAGFVAYEAAAACDAALPAKAPGAFPLAWFGLFRRVEERQALPAGSADGAGDLPWQPSITRADYHRCFQAIRDAIRAGDVYQVNLTYRLRARAEVDPWALFLRTLAGHPPPYAAFVDTGEWALCSASPELFFSLDGDRIESRPMKGTAARGLWFEDDRRQSDALRASAKERAENVMIADMVRNDLGRIAASGSVEAPALFAVEQYPTLWQMTSTVRARTDAPLDGIFAALFPPASITGAPKRRAMQIIDSLETTPRGAYTGAIGCWLPNRRAQFSVAIRTIQAHQPTHRLEYGVGGGIVWDSDVERELDECAVKARVLGARRPDFGLLETLRWSPAEGYALLDRHLTRLAQSAAYFDFAVDAGCIQRELAAQAGRLPPLPHRVRLVVGRDGDVQCQAAPLDADAMAFGPIHLARAPVDRRHALLYHKTTDRSLYAELLRQCPGARDVLLFNEEGEITESTIANVACEIDGRLYTPPLACGLLPGAYRAWMLDQGRMQERVLTIDDVRASSALYLMNAVRGLQRVRLIVA